MVIKSSSVPDCAVYDNYDSSSGNEDDRCTVSRLLKIIYFCTGGVVIRSYISSKSGPYELVYFFWSKKTLCAKGLLPHLCGYKVTLFFSSSADGCL